MPENEKFDCIDSLIFGLNRTADWRAKMAGKFPTDPRNGRAADRLAALAVDARELTDQDWFLLKPHCSWASEPWREAISQTARMVGFKNKITSLPAFVNSLMGVLQS